MTELIEIENCGTSVIIRFARPEIRSPLSVAVLDAIERLIDRLGDEVKRLVFTGVGDVFASGADLREISALTKGTARDFALRGQKLMNRIATTERETTAAINGFCFGGALDLALACERRIASPEATFCHPGARLGIITGWGGTQRLPRLIGEANALEMFLTASPISATEALRIGLVDEIAADPVLAALEVGSVI
ncbi:MAG TPA: enoyl-CoA hydratase/isomerase family protein [Pyrinomonadaceae bacterium]|nr:enoyl-CoA hydratase/isomerase family protein [Chloracidobacterium sp.]HRJ89003.1 enoyl-CoA hydratase/isomerase family protein [Pyrinomonadaceae bacterium]HRK51589.1 enoyl-CoA hydratase/isomerase family protein [Pyrinomonadaceae bacterium]